MKDGQVTISKREEFFLISILERTNLKHSQSVDDTNINKQIIFQCKTYFRTGKFTFTKDWLCNLKMLEIKRNSKINESLPSNENKLSTILNIHR